MKNIQIKLFTGAAVMLVMAAACAKVAENDWEEEGVIRFSASAQAPEVEFPATKTAYGDVSGSTKILTWSENDRISIYAPNEYNYYDGQTTIPAVSYRIGGQSLSGTVSTATGVTAVTANTALQWGSATGAGSHKFYGRYPDPTWNTGANTPYGDSELFKNQELKSAFFTCYLPAMQPFSRTGFVCAPTMQYLYMTAYAAVNRNATVALNFKPAVSAFHIKFKNQYVGETFIVKSVELVSESKYLSGSYSMNIEASASTPTLSSNTGSDADKRAGVDFGVGLELTKDTYLDVTIFTRPVEFNDLSIVITTTNGDVQKLELKATAGGSFLTFPAGKYFEITCGDVPDPFVYTLDIAGGDVVAATGEGAGTVSNPYTLEIDCQGVAKSTTFSLVSMKEKLGLITGTPWKVEYTTTPENPNSWSTTSPVTNFSAEASSYDGSTSGETVTVAMPAGSSGVIGSTTIDTFHFDHSDGGATEGSALDLSFYDGVSQTVYDTAVSTNQETANCYIIRGAGWYKFPLVYGNGIKAGAANTNAYRVASGAGRLSHLVKGDGNNIYNAGTLADVKITTATTVDLLWQDCTDNIFTTIKLDDLEGDDGIEDHLVFHVENPKPCNAVIQVTDGTYVLWSWHIWLVADEQNLKQEAVTNYYGRTLGMLSSNLGQLPVATVTANGYPRQDVYVRFTTTADNAKAKSVVLKVTRPQVITSSYPDGYAVSPTFQQGRKDPMLTIGADCATERTKDGATPGMSYKGSLASPPSVNKLAGTTIANAIRNPGIFFTGDVSWYTGARYYNLWDIYQSSTVPTSDYNGGIKSVYDPCPRGYRVARKFDFSGFTKDLSGTTDPTKFNVIGSFSYGWTFKKNSSDTEGIFFPQNRYRSGNTGAINGSEYTAIWTASSTGADNGYNLGYTPSRIESNGNDRPKEGDAVRPVVD